MVDRPHKPSSLPNTAAAAKSAGPQPTVDISDDNSRVTARLPSGESVTILLYGATVISWKNADGSDNLWLSEKAALDGSKPVRGGIPVVFPVFGPPPANHATSSLPQHGFARNSRWEYLGKSTSEASADPEAAAAAAAAATTAADSSSVKLDFGLYSSNLSAEARKAWPYDFGVVYSVTLGPNSLQTAVNVRNEGDKAWDFQVLFHTYLSVKDISKTQVTGLLGVTYTDKVLTPISTITESHASLPITGETDRVYKAIPQSTTSVVVDGKPRFDVVRDNLPDTVVWNPWKEKAHAMADFAPDDAYKSMICVEAGAVAEWTKLEAGDTWEGGVTYKSLL
ncbi:galactose mutarotase-like domain-containing protein [Phyllosticta citriasiana]|uniref:galactose mutarotase-like domain-containing protein n=1 Tax=Phyllosticta citriasiana TaxID=595635 RepID=UPI0030FD60C8